MNIFARSMRPLVFLIGLTSFAATAADWPMSGGQIENTRMVSGSPISGKTVGRLRPVWGFRTIPDTGDANTPIDAVGSTPVIDGDYIYFTSLQGYLFKLNRYTGQEIWRKSYLRDLSAPGYVLSEGRGSPYVSGNLIIVGNSYHMLEQLCPVIGAPEPIPGRCHSGSGAIVVAVNKNTGQVVWRQRVDPHPAAKVSSSISGFKNMIFVPVSHFEEEWARTYPNIYDATAVFGSVYPCCSARGSVVALYAKTGRVLWKRYLSIGTDAGSELAPEVRALLFGKGYFGVSTYGHNPAIDPGRRLVYVATSQTTTAPASVAACENARRLSGDPNANIEGLPAGVTCNNINEKLKTYGNAVVIALDMNDGAVRWAFYARKYDAWNHSCDAPDWGSGGGLPPILVPVPASNAANCFYDPIGSNFGFGMQPAFVKSVKLANGRNVDLVVAGNKDRRLFALNADNGRMVWERDIDPGGILGGAHYGLAADGKRVYVGTANSSNTGRDIHTGFVTLQEFLEVNGFSAVGLRTGRMSKRDGEEGQERPAPGPFLPYAGPNLVYHQLGYPDNIGYPDTYPPLLGDDFFDRFMKEPASGPWSLWSVVNPPADVSSDGVNIFAYSTRLKTIAGMVSAVNLSDGSIVWQRPAVDGVGGQMAPAPAQGSVTVVNDILFSGYSDGKGTMVALDSATGVKKFEFHAQIDAGGEPTSAGAVEAGPAVVDHTVYWGVGSYTGALLLNRSGVRYAGGNRVIAFRPEEQ